MPLIPDGPLSCSFKTPSPSISLSWSFGTPSPSISSSWSFGMPSLYVSTLFITFKIILIPPSGIVIGSLVLCAPFRTFNLNLSKHKL